MKRSILSLAVILALAISAHARSITTGVAANITRNAGQTIPLTFNCSGFAAGQTVDLWLVNARTWQRTPVEYSLPVSNGVNTHALVIPWDWLEVGPYVVDIVSGSAHCQSPRIITIRSAVIWPYAGTIYPKYSQVAVVWNTNIDADFLTVSLFNYDTGTIYGIDLEADPRSGQLFFNTPINDSGNHFIVCLNAYVWVESSPEQIEMGESDYYPEPIASTQSAFVAIH